MRLFLSMEKVGVYFCYNATTKNQKSGNRTFSSTNCTSYCHWLNSTWSCTPLKLSNNISYHLWYHIQILFSVKFDLQMLFHDIMCMYYGFHDIFRLCVYKDHIFKEKWSNDWTINASSLWFLLFMCELVMWHRCVSFRSCIWTRSLYDLVFLACLVLPNKS